MRKVRILLLYAIMFLLGSGSVSAQGLMQLEFQGKVEKKKSAKLGARVSGAELGEFETEELPGTKVSAKEEFVPQEGPVDPKAYILGPNDILTLKIWESEEYEHELTITPEGELVIPLVGVVDLRWKSLDEARAIVGEALKKRFKDFSFSMTLKHLRRFKAHITGQVKFPGSYDVTAADRVSTLIYRAEGATDFPDIQNILIIRRNGTETLSVDLSRYLKLGDISQNPYLLDGDVVYLPRLDFRDNIVVVVGQEITGIYTIEENEPLNGFLKRIDALFHTSDISHIEVARGGRVDTVDFVDKGEKYPLLPGDTVYIPTISDSVYVVGFVTSPGAVPFNSGESIEGYIALAGGPSEDGNISCVKVKRLGKSYSLSKIDRIRRGDVIIVGERFSSRIVRYLTPIAQVASLILTGFAAGVF